MRCARASALIGLVVAAVAMSSACGGGDEAGPGGGGTTAAAADMRAQWTRLRDCLRSAGARLDADETTFGPDDGFGPEGRVFASLRGVDVDAGVFRDAHTAAQMEGAAAGLAGGSWVTGVPLRELLGRHGNVMVMYERVPPAVVKASVERCVGGGVTLDAKLDGPLAGAPEATCMARLRRAFAEFPQYGGARPALTDDREEGGCAATLSVKAPLRRVLRYYEHRLAARGWHVGRVEREEAEGEGGSAATAGTLGARRGGLVYSVTFESGEALGGATGLVVRVGRAGG